MYVFEIFNKDFKSLAQSPPREAKAGVIEHFSLCLFKSSPKRLDPSSFVEKQRY